MKTAIETLMDKMLANNWAWDENGDVESPTGYFAIVRFDYSMLDDVNSLDLESDEFFELRNFVKRFANVYTSQDSYGNTDYIEFDNWLDLKAFFEASEGAYYLWSDNEELV